jgi:hypothetical protein
MGGDESLDGRDPLGLQGMSDYVGVSVETVHMEVKPRAGLSKDKDSINMFGEPEWQRSLYQMVTKETKTFSVPTNMQEFSKSCFKLIGTGAVFCTAKNCTVAHRGGAAMSVSSHDMVVWKTTTKAFVEARMLSNSIDEEALEDWESLSLSFEASWSDRFLIASAAIGLKALLHLMQPWKSKKTFLRTKH